MQKKGHTAAGNLWWSSLRKVSFPSPRSRVYLLNYFLFLSTWPTRPSPASGNTGFTGLHPAASFFFSPFSPSSSPPSPLSLSPSCSSTSSFFGYFSSVKEKSQRIKLWLYIAYTWATDGDFLCFGSFFGPVEVFRDEPEKWKQTVFVYTVPMAVHTTLLHSAYSSSVESCIQAKTSYLVGWWATLFQTTSLEVAVSVGLIDNCKLLSLLGSRKSYNYGLTTFCVCYCGIYFLSRVLYSRQ